MSDAPTPSDPKPVKPGRRGKSVKKGKAAKKTKKVKTKEKAAKKGVADKPKQGKATKKSTPSRTAKPRQAGGPSEVEALKLASNYLRGSIVEQLDDPRDAFSDEVNELLKFHGMYQQDNRDLRNTVGPDGKKRAKVRSLMVRTKLPGGKLTSGQLLAELDLCDELGDGTLRITNRQGLQLHGVGKKDVRETIRRLNEAGLSTMGACGDVARNVTCCPAPFRHDPVHQQMQDMADRISGHLAPRTSAYGDVWLDADAHGNADANAESMSDRAIDPVEPIYGKTYLPRKFKVGIALPGDNCVDVHSNDLGLLAVCENFNVVGYTVMVGGGMGVTPRKKTTFPAVAQKLCFARPEEVVDLVEAILRMHRDHGNRTDRKRARLKYLVADWGIDRFREKVRQYFGQPLVEPRSEDVWGFDNHLGWFEQGDGRWFLGLHVENGRIADRDGCTLKTALRSISSTYAPGIRLTANQSILFTDIRFEDRDGIEAILRGSGVMLPDETTMVRRGGMACVALPMCPAAITEAERVLPGVIDRLEEELKQLGLASEQFTTRMTGCPNGCARPYVADIGLVGRGKGKYTIYLGGRVLSDRIGFIFRQGVTLAQLVPTLLPVLVRFQQDRQEGETLGDFCHRLGPEAFAM